MCSRRTCKLSLEAVALEEMTAMLSTSVEEVPATRIRRAGGSLLVQPANLIQGECSSRTVMAEAVSRSAILL